MVGDRPQSATLIQCTATKRDTAAPARDLYDESAYFRKMRAWAEARNDPWFILSAKHGLLNPHSGVEPYDERGLSVEQAKEIADTFTQWEFTAVHVCAGRDYLDPLTPELEAKGIDVVDSFAGLRIGERMRELDERTTELRHATA
jgi:hypothetical protein